MSEQNRLSFWDLAALPERSGGDWVAWLRTRTGIHVKITMGSWTDLSRREATLIVSQLAGLMNVETLERDLATTNSAPGVSPSHHPGERLPQGDQAVPGAETT